MNSTDLALIFKALGDSTRLDIIRLLNGKELCVCDILDAFSLSQPAISHHLKILKQAGLLLDSRQGKWIFYRLNPVVFQEVVQYLHGIPLAAQVERLEPVSPYCLKQEEA